MATIPVDIAYQWAITHRQAGRMAEAEALLRQVVAAQPGHVRAWHQLGLVVLTTGRPAEALGLLARAVAASPQEPYCHSDLGVAYSALGRADEAIACFERALQLQPDLAHTQRNLSDVLHRLGRTREAIAGYERAIALEPNDASAHNNLGSALLSQGRLAEANACYERAVQLDPGILEAQSNYGDTLAKLGRLDEGLERSQRVLSLNPNFPDGHLNMAVVWWLKGRYGEAEECYRRAIALRPDFANAHLNLALLFLLLGRFEEGWREYEWRWRAPAHLIHLRHFAQPMWDGQPAPGKTILIHVEQGLGDTLQFARYLPLVCARSGAARVVLECQPPLAPLLSQLRGLQTDIAPYSVTNAHLPPFDLFIPLFSMPLALQRFEPVPMASPYLQADMMLRAGWRERLGAGGELRVGLAWAGNPLHGDDRRRSIAPEKLSPILRVPGVRFYSLQVEPRGPLPAPLATAGVSDLTAEISSFADSAALVAELDLVITVDTAAAHLAGALGRPVWVLVPFAPDWRWGVGREDSPWYPSMRLFRQPEPENWEPVIERVAVALDEHVSTSSILRGLPNASG